ncbi:MAG: hypothetical protein ACTIKE_07200 [Sphingobacterium sp.]
MKTKLINGAVGVAFLSSLAFTSCSDDNDGPSAPGLDADRWITISLALDDPSNDAISDGNEGTMVYSVSAEDAASPEKTIDVLNQGMGVKSERTARLQASQDGKFLYNIQYTGDDGGIFNKYQVMGANKFQDTGDEVDIEPYAGQSPRWVIAKEGVGIAVNLIGSKTVYEGSAPNYVYKYTRGNANLVALDLDNPQILKTNEFPFPLSAEDEAAGYSVGRIDVPVISQNGDKVFIGCRISKVNPNSVSIVDGEPKWENDDTRDGTKTLVVDYPNLDNPKIISSSKTTGNTNGYRSRMMFLGDDGNVYQATSGEKTGGSKILRIDKNTNEYDENYVFSLDAALGVTDSYIESWRYVGGGIGYVIYSLQVNGKRTGGYIARVDLNANSALKMDLGGVESKLDFGQHQNIGLYGDLVYIPVVSAQDTEGYLYVFNKKTGAAQKGAKLINQVGNRYIGAY